MKRLFASFFLVVLIGLKPVYKNFKGKQLCLALQNDQFNVEIANKLEEYSGVEGRAVYDYCAKLGVSEMTSEQFPY
tara:strand:+ start:808 stop:1035 length:228 start_codon:yes stop_codon:yes gene_type:complete